MKLTRMCHTFSLAPSNEQNLKQKFKLTNTNKTKITFGSLEQNHS